MNTGAMINVASVLPPFSDACTGATINVVSVLPPFPDASTVATIGVAFMLLPLPGHKRRDNDRFGLRAASPSRT